MEESRRQLVEDEHRRSGGISSSSKLPQVRDEPMPPASEPAAPAEVLTSPTAGSNAPPLRLPVQEEVTHVAGTAVEDRTPTPRAGEAFPDVAYHQPVTSSEARKAPQTTGRTLPGTPDSLPSFRTFPVASPESPVQDVQDQHLPPVPEEQVPPALQVVEEEMPQAPQAQVLEAPHQVQRMQVEEVRSDAAREARSRSPRIRSHQYRQEKGEAVAIAEQARDQCAGILQQLAAITEAIARQASQVEFDRDNAFEQAEARHRESQDLLQGLIEVVNGANTVSNNVRNSQNAMRRLITYLGECSSQSLAQEQQVHPINQDDL